jgi:hypothetical protein
LAVLVAGPSSSKNLCPPSRQRSKAQRQRARPGRMAAARSAGSAELRSGGGSGGQHACLA